MKKNNIVILLLLTFALQACSQTSNKKTGAEGRDVKVYPEAKPDAYWKKVLSANAYDIMVNRGTETPFHNPYWNNHAKGIYVSAATGKPLFSSDAKFESGTGWPSFFKPITADAVMVVKDTSYGMERDEVVERSTGLHLGHVFNDGPAPTGLRYCLDSYALKFIPAK